MKAASGKSTSEEVPVPTLPKTKTGTKVFAATTSNQANAVTKARIEKPCIACKDSHPLWRCTMFSKKTRTGITKMAVEKNSAFLVSTKDIHSANALNHENGAKTAAEL